MSEMIVQVRNKMLRRIGGVNHFVSHNKDYTIQFQFDESWNNVRTKMAVFAYEDGEYGSEIFDGDTCNVPEFPREGRILIGVKAGEDLSTELLCIPVCKSADDVITDEYDEPDPKIYEQILDIINNLWNGGTTVYPSPVKFLASPSAAKVGDLIRVKEVDENGDVTRTEGFDVGVELEKKIDAPQVAQIGEVLTVEAVDAEGKPTKWKTAPAAAKQKQADWAQNDEGAVDFVKNRFGGYTKTVTETKTVVVEAGAQSAPDEFASFPPFTAGDVVNIVVNNVDYSLTAYRPSDAPDNLEIAVVMVTTDNSGWALVCGKLGEIDNSYIIYFENSTDSEITIQYNVSREEAVTIEPKYIPNVKPEDIKDMYYTAAEEIDLAGYTLTNVNYKGDHDEVYPFELGQVWNASGININFTNLEVKQADDGTLYIGDLNKSNPPFFISTTSGGAHSAWISNGNPGAMNLVGVSGKITTEVVHKISDKYIPDSVAYKDELPQMDIMELTVPNTMKIAHINVDDTYNSAHVIVKGSEFGKLSLTNLLIHYKNNTYNKYIFNALTKSELKSSDIPYVMFLYIDMSGSGTAWLLNPVVASTEKMDVIIPSSTIDSTKKFKITVNDSGKLSVAEVNT